MKQKKTLQILLLVFAGLLVLYAGISFYKKNKSSKEDSDQTLITNLKSLTSISYNNNGETLSFEKDRNKWYYSKNKKYPITQSSLESLASTFQKVEAVRELKNADALKDYGLDKPTYTVRVKISLENPLFIISETQPVKTIILLMEINQKSIQYLLILLQVYLPL